MEVLDLLPRTWNWNLCKNPPFFTNIIIMVYKRRWYVLVVFGLYSATQNLVWNTWGPISTTSEEAFGWDNSTIAWLSNWGPISYILSGLFFPWLLQVKGLRFSVVISMALVAVGTLMRIVSVDSDKQTHLIHFGQFLNGLAGPIGMGAVSRISVTWFPLDERVTATALSTSLGVVGAALSFVLGPYYLSRQLPDRQFPLSIDLRQIPPDNQLSVDQLKNTTFRVFLWSGIVTGLILIYFPSTPPKPPCKSAVTDREEYWDGMKAIWRNRPFLTVALTYGTSLGVLSVWASVLNINLSTLGISQEDCGQIGFHSIWIGCAASLVMGRFADYFGLSMKMLIVGLYLAASLAFGIFLYALLSNTFSSTAVIWLTVIGGSTLLNASTPLMYELACELVYPIGEATPNGLMAFLNNVAGILFLAVFSLPSVGTMWMNWTLVLSTAACVPLMLTLEESYRRMALEGRESGRRKFN